MKLFSLPRSLTLFPVFFLVAACGGNSQDELLQIGKDIVAMEAKVGAVDTIDCPLAVPGETEGESYACGI